MIKLIDLSKDLIDLALENGIDAVYGDYFVEGYKQTKPVFVTASNPAWTFGGGIDYIIAKHFSHLCSIKQNRGGENERIANLIFTITVDNNLKATKEMVGQALKFAIENTCDNETLCLTGLGTGIGCLSIQEFIDLLKSLTPSHIK
jgi:hypothetical protein